MDADCLHDGTRIYKDLDGSRICADLNETRICADLDGMVGSRDDLQPGDARLAQRVTVRNQSAAGHLEAF